MGSQVFSDACELVESELAEKDLRRRPLVVGGPDEAVDLRFSVTAGTGSAYNCGRPPLQSRGHLLAAMFLEEANDGPNFGVPSRPCGRDRIRCRDGQQYGQQPGYASAYHFGVSMTQGKGEITEYGCGDGAYRLMPTPQNRS